MNVVVIGASGFLGSVLARRMLARGDRVSLLLRPESSLARLGPVADSCLVARCGHGAEIRDFLRSVDPDAILYSVCLYGGPGTTVADMIAANLSHGVVVVEACLTLSRERERTFVNAGTSLPESLNAYSSMKAGFAKLCSMMSADSSRPFQFIDMRLESLYGWEDRPSRFTSEVIHACCRNQSMLSLTAGEQQRDFLHVDDAAAAFDTVISRREAFCQQDSISVGSGHPRTIRDFAETVHALCESSTQLSFGEVAYRPREAMCCVGDPSRLHRLGWRQQLTFD